MVLVFRQTRNGPAFDFRRFNYLDFNKRPLTELKGTLYSTTLTHKTGGEWETQPLSHGNSDGEFRSIGVADMAAAIVNNRPHRASGALALHALEAMEAFQISSDEGRRVKLETTVERPAMLKPGMTTGIVD